jgi:hypothetical protein
MREVEMNEAPVKTTPYQTWQKAVLIGCMVIALLGTLFVVGMMVKVSGTITEYGGNLNAAFFVVFIHLLLSTWLFAGLGALLVYVAKRSNDIATWVQSSVPASVKRED